MPTNLVYVLLATSFVFMLIPTASCAASWLCRPCQGRECDESPGLCPWGEARDNCGRRVCSKGPGERCGGTFRVFGECGEGLMCKDEICHGCSSMLLFECYDRM